MFRMEYAHSYLLFTRQIVTTYDHFVVPGEALTNNLSLDFILSVILACDAFYVQYVLRN